MRKALVPPRSWHPFLSIFLILSCARAARVRERVCVRALSFSLSRARERARARVRTCARACTRTLFLARSLSLARSRSPSLVPVSSSLLTLLLPVGLLRSLCVFSNQTYHSFACSLFISLPPTSLSPTCFSPSPSPSSLSRALTFSHAHSNSFTPELNVGLICEDF